MAIGTGTKLGPYELSDMLGAGGMGEVYRARDPRLKRDVAVKVLPSSFSSDPERLHRFEQEAQAAAALNHPNILAVYDVGTRDGSPYIVSELLKGSTLRELLNSGPIPVRKAVEYAVQIAHGLAAAHEKGIVHRDLKPENIFVTDDRRVKLLDFGLAKLTRSEIGSEGQTLTGVDSQVGAILGTVGYMSPEQVRAKAVDSRSDIFSFGAILYEMLSGKRAFQGESPAETMSAIVKEEPPDLTETNAGISPALDRIVRHCLEKNPAARFQSARDVAFDLEMVSGISQPSAIVQPATAAVRLRRFAPLLWGLAVVTAAVTAFLFGRQHTSALPKFQPLTYERGAIPNARFAPDGRSVIYDATWDGKPVRVFTTPADAALPRPFEFEQAHLFAVSASGEIAVGLGGRLGNHLDVRGTTLARAPLAGGTPREILDNVAAADWAPDETLAVVHTINGHDRIESPLGRVLYETNGWIAGLRVSPKGDRFAFLDHPRWPDDRGAVAVVDRAGHKQTLSQDYESADGLAWSPAGEVWFTAAMGGNYRSLRAVDMAGRERTILQVPGALRLCDIAHNGRVLLAVDNEKVGVKAYAPDQKGERDLSWAGWTLASDISPDHKWLGFDEQSALAGANYIVGMRKLDGSAPVRLGEGNGGSLSPDGKWVASAPLTGPPRIVLLPTGIGTAREITVPLEKVSYPQPFPDNRHVMFIGADRGHAFGCYVQDIESGRLQAVTPEGALLSSGMPTQRTSCVPSPDGTAVIASNPEGKLTIFPISGGAPRVIPGETVGLQPSRWCPDGVYAYGSHQSSTRIVRIDPSNGRQTVVRELVPGDPAGLIGISPVVLSPDAKAYAYSYRRTLSELYVVDGLK